MSSRCSPLVSAENSENNQDDFVQTSYGQFRAYGSYTSPPSPNHQSMTTITLRNHVSTIVPISSASNPPTPHQYSSRTPGEGYPFPRIQRSRSHYSTNIPAATVTTVRDIESPPVRVPAPASAQPPAIDMEVFSQLLAMEDESPNEQTNCRFNFTKGLVKVYFEDGEGIVEEMDGALSRSDYTKLSQLAHYLRGSAASLGVCRVAATCEALELEILRRPTQDPESLGEKVQDIKRGQLAAREWFDDFYRQ